MMPISGPKIICGHCCVGSVAEMVTVQAAARPNAVALSCSYHLLTYKELDEKATALADIFRERGIGPEAVVGVCLQRSPAMVIGALAALKAGAAYLPMDPEAPAARLAFMARDAQISALVTGQAGEKKLPHDTQPNIVLDEFGDIIDAPTCSPSAVAPAATARDNLAYVIYTSGSTGDPNGVEVTHDNILNLIRWHQQAFQVTPEDRASQIANVSFDAAVWEIWPYLTAGACVHIPGNQVVNDPEALRDWLISEAITIAFVPTPMAELLMGLQWPGRADLRLMLTGADALHRFPGEKLPFQLINNYGPTECTVVATSGRVLPDDSKHGAPSIGLPIANARIYILDESGRQVPAGVEGELHIGGAGVARGYRNRPELTARRFIADPFASEPEGRLFKTGDIVRKLSNGQIAFVGRMDDQIKLRGFRIEPGEITAALNSHPGVRQSLVVAQQTAPGTIRLVGYIVPAAEGLPTRIELRNFLRERLPDYMVPDTFVMLESLPLSAHGKIDRTKLPAPSDENILQDESFTAARTDMEKKVAGILAGLLGMRQVDVEANFFALGGHSLVGTQLIARIRSIFGIEMNLRVLFESPTVAQLSVEIERLVHLKREGTRDKEVQYATQSGTQRANAV